MNKRNQCGPSQATHLYVTINVQKRQDTHLHVKGPCGKSKDKEPDTLGVTKASQAHTGESQ